MHQADKKSFAVVQVIPLPSGGGAELLVRELTKRLPRFGIPSYAVYFCNRQGVEIGDSETVLGLHFLRSPLAILKLCAFLRRLRKKHGRVIVHTHLTWPFLYVPIAAVKMGVPLLHTEHNTYNRRRGLKFFKLIERHIYRQYEKIVCNSEGTKRQLLKWLDNGNSAYRTVVVYNGVRLLPLKKYTSFPDKKLKLISVGSLTKKKGFDLSIQAVSYIKNIVSEYVILGDGPERDRIMSQIRRTGLERISELHGWSDDIIPYLHNADIMLIPSRWEGFGLVGVEALSTGLPIVAFQLEGLREVLSETDAATLVPPADIKAFAGAIQTMHSKIQAGFDFRYLARETAEQFKIDDMVEKYLEQYLEIAEERGWANQ